MARVCNQQNPAGKWQGFNHLPHQAVRIQHSLSFEHAIVRTAIDQHAPGTGIVGNIDDFGSHYATLNRLGGFLKRPQTTVLTRQPGQ